jgi:hypothetical protein
MGAAAGLEPTSTPRYDLQTPPENRGVTVEVAQRELLYPSLSYAALLISFY